MDETDVKLEKKVAQGSEGDVWKGTLRQHGWKAHMPCHCCNPFMLQALLLSSLQLALPLLGRKEIQSGEKEKS